MALIINLSKMNLIYIKKTRKLILTENFSNAYNVVFQRPEIKQDL